MDMITVEEGEFNGLACVWLSNGQVRLAVTTGRGLRIVLWGWQQGDNIFAELPEFALETPAGLYHFLGGHRLWHAPEALNRTYQPEEWPVAVEITANGARFAAPADGAGIVKEIQLALAAATPRVTVTHMLRNAGLWPVELAPWALSMCRLGGVVLLPQPQGPADPDGLLPNRRFSFWPYSDPTDSRVHLGNQVALVHARPAPRNKLGYRNRHGWVAYWLEGTLFSKQFDPHLDADHPDFGCNTECFLNDSFVELETLGPLVRLAPEAAVSHTEVWRLHADVPPVATEAEAVAVAGALGLMGLEPEAVM
ncbi:MAG: hypothetical protein M5U01_26050 [Ardenticatenaceae bacterium]|nr:hypothetical protein [Ardenticatenaceae bacterium]HBY98403.1 hypothetical protein [Chloroflexota bacterium]